MNPNAERTEKVFNQALDFRPEERPAFLAGACGEDIALRQRVEALLAAHEQASGFLPAEGGGTTVLDPAQTHLPASVADETEGTLIGRYKLLEKLGEGGFGTVWLAEQKEPVRRKVALKIIKLGMDTKQVVARFEAERQALALMDHPNIAKVLDAGMTETVVGQASRLPAGHLAREGLDAGKMPASTGGTPVPLSAGRPYFVMELVRGIPITKFCDENHMPTKDRLDLFITVCHAIQHAHQKGIIHRDIKPSNILVTLHDGVPVSKVIDFGIAKATQGELTDKTIHTMFQQFIGTPAYMSPEQAEMSGLDIDTRSDIYSLGVLLYELLVGKTPFDAKELLQSGLDEMRRRIRGEEPVRPSTRVSTMADAERTNVAKHRQSDAAKLVHLFRGDLDWIVMKCLEKDRARRYETANGLAMDLRRYLNNEAVLARPPSAAYRFQKLVRRNKLAFAAAGAIALALVLGVIASTWQALRATRAEKLAAGRLVESENARKDAEAIATFLSEVFRSPDPGRDGHTITVKETLDKAVQKLETDLADQPARRAQLEASIASTYRGLGLFRDAIPLQEKVRDYYLATHGLQHTNTASALGALAWSYHRFGRNDEALKLLKEVLEVRRQLHGPEHQDTLGAMDRLADFFTNVRNNDEALKLRELVLGARRKALGNEDPATLGTMNDLAFAYGKNRAEDAIKVLEEVVALRRKAQGPAHSATLSAINNLAGFSYHAGRRAEAVKMLEAAMTLREKMPDRDNEGIRLIMGNLSAEYFTTRRCDEAIKLREELLAANRRLLGPEHGWTLGDMSGLAAYYACADRYEDARKLLEDLVRLSQKAWGPEHRETLDATSRLASAYFAEGRQAEAISLQAETCEKTPTNSFNLLTLAVWQTWCGQDDDYEATRRRALAQAEGTDRDYAAEQAARTYCARSSTNPVLLSKALALARRAVQLGTNSPSPWSHLALGMAEYRHGQYALAEQALELAEQKAADNRQRRGRPWLPSAFGVETGPPREEILELRGQARLLRAMSLFQQDRTEEARKLLREVEAQMPALPQDERKPLADGKQVFSHDLLIWWMFCKEAKSLINQTAPAKP